MEAWSCSLMVLPWLGTKVSCVEKPQSKASYLLKPKLQQQLQAEQWLKRCWKSESSQKGIVLYQMVEKMFKGRSFPMALVQEILTFAMPVPTIIDQLDLWAHVNDWMTTIRGRPSPCGGLDGSGRELSFSVELVCGWHIGPHSSQCAQTMSFCSKAKTPKSDCFCTSGSWWYYQLLDPGLFSSTMSQTWGQCCLSWGIVLLYLSDYLCVMWS